MVAGSLNRVAAMEMYSLRVSREQKQLWDAYAAKLGVDTSTMVRGVVDSAVSLNPDVFWKVYGEQRAS